MGAEIWRVINPHQTNRVGQHPGYEVRPDHSVTSLLAPNDIPQQRAGFSVSTLWITPYDPEELCRRYEAGEPMADLLRIPPLPEGKTPWDMLARH